MSVHDEILEWSRTRPIWQQDALRRLILNGDLIDEDISELVELCKSKQGLSDQHEFTPLNKEHIPTKTQGAPSVSLDSVYHHHGVNALAENQTLTFSPKLTLVYGDNGSGKTGYTRILKSACRARGQEQILGNVVSGVKPPIPSVKVKYRVGTDDPLVEWTNDSQDHLLSRISVFDSQSASIYLTEKTDIAFRPYGLDLFDKLVQACKAVRAQLEAERKILSHNTLEALQAQIPEGTAALRFLVNLSSLTKEESLRALTNISDKEESRIASLEKSLQELQSNDPAKLVQQLTLRVGRLQALAVHSKSLEKALSSESINAILQTRSDGRLKNEEAKQLRDRTFPNDLLPGTGDENWRLLWEAARQFSREQAYPTHTYPHTEAGSTCVLCQQHFDHVAIDRLKQFENYVTSTTERELKQLRERFVQLRKSITELPIANEASQDAINEIRLENEKLAEIFESAFIIYEQRHKGVLKALTDNSDLESKIPDLQTISDKVSTVIDEVTTRIKVLKSTSHEEVRKRIIDEHRELRARKLLSSHYAVVMQEIERRTKFAAYGLCLDETKTQTITQQSSTIAKNLVSQKLRDAFNEELDKLRFRHVEVELKEAGGADGVFYHKLILTRAPSIDLPSVASEGEQRCLSIAAFFAELATADDQSGIVFDDPVSSLDFRWRNDVARRLVEEANARQVIVFTHDIVFLLALKQYADDLQVETMDQYVRFLGTTAGVCTNDLPWVALPVKRKIGVLKNGLQTVEKLFRGGHQDEYEARTTYLYGLLREAWERALEEVLLGGIVERFRNSVQTQHVGILSDISEEDCRKIEIAMTKCSTWLPGHDKAPAARAPIPGPDELKSDIEDLENWVAAIRKRRN